MNSLFGFISKRKREKLFMGLLLDLKNINEDTNMDSEQRSKRILANM
ncbi:hypothetical protein J2X61_006124 [Bacillus sp. 3255]|nr:hypothetical protein [Bacillus sp. 3255]